LNSYSYVKYFQILQNFVLLRMLRSHLTQAHT